MLRKTSASEVIESLKLAPLPIEGGFFRETFRNTEMTCIYYLITQESFSTLHSLSSSEIWHYYAGNPAQMIQISPSGELLKFTLGSDLKAGQSPQVIVKAHSLQGTKIVGDGTWTLFGCSVSPAFEAAQFTHVQRCEMIKKFPYHFDLISRYTKS